MRRSYIYERIIVELERLNKINTSFKRSDLKELISEHQKYASFLYKHSDEKNQGKMVLYFERKPKRNSFLNFKLNRNIFRQYYKK